MDAESDRSEGDAENWPSRDREDGSNRQRGQPGTDEECKGLQPYFLKPRHWIVSGEYHYVGAGVAKGSKTNVADADGVRHRRVSETYKANGIWVHGHMESNDLGNMYRLRDLDIGR